MYSVGILVACALRALLGTHRRKRNRGVKSPRIHEWATTRTNRTGASLTAGRPS